MNPIFQKALDGNFPKAHYTQSRLIKIQQSDLVQFLFWLDPNHLCRVGNTIKLNNTEHSNIIVYNDRAYDFYTKESLSHFDVCKKVLGLSFPQTAFLLDYFYTKVKKLDVQINAERTFSTSASAWISKSETPLNIDLSYIIDEDLFSSEESTTRHKAYQLAFAYLSNRRSIDRHIVQNLIRQKFLMLDKNNNLCFITYNDPLEKDCVIAITKRGTRYKEFKQNQTNITNTGFLYAPKDTLTTKDAEHLYVFESCIDLLSYMTLAKQEKVALGPNSVLVSLNGVGNESYIFTTHNTYPTINTLHLCLDIDITGIEATKTLTSRYGRLKNRFTSIINESTTLADATSANELKMSTVSEVQTNLIKDWNELLCRVSADTVVS